LRNGWGRKSTNHAIETSNGVTYIVKGIMALEMTKEERRRRSSKCYTREIGNGGIPWNWN
jgi:hypothetical protein